ncbi:MAG: T9SS type A sorting domain-containing protein [candidate division KSB1 bacterium]|nr:T9SS type A sorting domain-containing protein [candidate division KSB1 bacterium]MDZ7301877.1 T9SS type A sorting domain-containing protein [candidate division KSB1 bacterium]
MKRYNLLCLFLLVPFLAIGQEVLETFDAAPDSGHWVFDKMEWGTPNNILNLFYVNDLVKVGTGSLKVDWLVQGTQSWGGYANFMHGAPETEVFDFSPYTHIKMWYYNAVPQSKPGTTHLRILLKDMSNVPTANRTMANIGQAEYWYSHFFILDTQPGWNELVLPLKDVQQQSDQGLWLPGWAGQAGNSTLDLDAIKAYKIEWSIDASVYDAANPLNSGSSAGTIYFDHLRLTGHAYPVINYFDSTGAKQDFTVAGTGTSSVKVTDNVQNALEGAATQIEWKVDADQSWGGYVSMTFSAKNFLPDMSGNTHLSLKYNNLVASDQPGNVVLRLQLHEYSEGDNQEELWFYETKTVLDSAAGWHKLMIPLNDRGVGPTPNDQGFSNPGWGGVPGNGKLDWNKIKKYEFAFSAAKQGTISTGTILFDNLELYGKRQTDFTPPEPPKGVAAVPDAAGNFNLVIWQDVPGEAEEKYTVYASKNPIADVNAPGVEVLAEGIAENTQTYVHYLFYPLQDKLVTYYYAVTAMDKAGNVGTPGVSFPGVTNTAKGMPTISLNPPANFAADGNLSEWENSGIKPFIFKKSVSHIGTGTFDNDDDLTITMYMAMDKQYFYFAVDAIDNVFSYDPAGDWWQDDAIEMFFGLYDGRPGPPHFARQRGAKPDYALQFRADGLFHPDNNSLRIYSPDSANYHFEGLGVSDYVIETKIRLRDITFGDDAPFVPVNGMRLPLDFSIHDSDSKNVRDGILTLSPINNDNSWQSPRNWTYVWIGDQEFPTAVEDKQHDGVLLSYSLSQNYPNPFNPTTTINYAIRKAGLVKIDLYNTLGQKVRTLVNEVKPAGTYRIEVRADELTSGLYFYRITAGDFVQTRKMLLMK